MTAKELIEEHIEVLENLTEEERRFFAIESKRRQIYKLHQLIDHLEKEGTKREENIKDSDGMIVKTIIKDRDPMAEIRCYRLIRSLENDIARMEGWYDLDYFEGNEKKEENQSGKQQRNKKSNERNV